MEGKMELKIKFFLLTLLIVSTNTDDGRSIEVDDETEHHVNRISDQVMALVDHYKNPDPVGLPGVPIPEPMFIPEIKFSAFRLKNNSLYGLSEFRVEELNINIDRMQLFGAVSFENLTIEAYPTILRNKMIIALGNVESTCRADLQVATNGDLKLREMHIVQFTFGKFDIDLPHTGASYVFKTFIMTIKSTVTKWLRDAINSRSDEAVQQSNDFLRRLVKYPLPNSIAPVDLAVAEGRKYVRNAGFDPYKIDDYKHSVGVFSINVSNILVSGFSTFYRTGNLTLSMKNNILHLEIHVSTKRLQGQCEWELSLGGLLSRYGSSSFSVEHLIVETKLSQPLNVRKKPKLDDLEMNIGNIQLRMDGTGTMDYLLEFLVNLLPNILRFQIVEVIEAKLKHHLKEIFDLIDIEKQIENLLPTLDDLTNANRTVSMRLDPPETSPDIDIYEEIAL